MNDFERLGGEEALRAIIDDFVESVFDDVMIGFIFMGKDKARIAKMEFLLASQQLGGPHVYTGRPIGRVHRPLPIMGGHFDRRRMILQNTLRDHQAPEDVVARWLEHVDDLRPQVLGQGVAPGHCDHDIQAQRGVPGGEEER
ncbi:MAG: group 1 truncated hemoglobin [Myxococcota bacterium]|nr:group 1 truncated hemoglobin [Myxococcota bacterium]